MNNLGCCIDDPTDLILPEDNDPTTPAAALLEDLDTDHETTRHVSTLVRSRTRRHETDVGRS